MKSSDVSTDSAPQFAGRVSPHAHPNCLHPTTAVHGSRCTLQQLRSARPTPCSPGSRRADTAQYHSEVDTRSAGLSTVPKRHARLSSDHTLPSRKQQKADHAPESFLDRRSAGFLPFPSSINDGSDEGCGAMVQGRTSIIPRSAAKAKRSRRDTPRVRDMSRAASLTTDGHLWYDSHRGSIDERTPVERLCNVR